MAELIKFYFLVVPIATGLVVVAATLVIFFTTRNLH